MMDMIAGATRWQSTQKPKRWHRIRWSPSTQSRSSVAEAAELVSTADVYLKFARMMLGQGQVDGVRLLKPETVALMTCDRLTEAQRATLVRDERHWVGEGFGLGVGIDIDVKKRTQYGASTNGAYGWPGAFGTWFRVDPKEKLILLYLVQFFASLVPENVPRIVTGSGTPLEALQRLTYAALGR